MLSREHKPTITQGKETIQILYTLPIKDFLDKLESSFYDVKRDAEARVAHLVAEKYFQEKGNEIFSKISFEEIKAMLLIELGQDLLKKMSERTQKTW
jgi:hypothetical protein